MRTSIDWLLIGYQHQSLLRLLLHDRCVLTLISETQTLRHIATEVRRLGAKRIERTIIILLISKRTLCVIFRVAAGNLTPSYVKNNKCKKNLRLFSR